MFRVRGIILPQTSLVVVASFFLVAVGQADGAYISFFPPSAVWAPSTFAVGATIQCAANESPYKSLRPKWFNNFDWKLVSNHSVLVVTEEMSHWKQPITLICKAYSERDEHPKVQGRYTFRVANTSSGAVAKTTLSNVVAGAAPNSVDNFGVISRISFSPPSSVYYPTTLAVGANIQCTAYGMSYPTFKWYDSNWNTVSWSSIVYVTENMRHWKQPITLRCKAQSSWPSREVGDFYTFQVANASSEPETTEAWVIAVAVIVPIVGLAAIAIAIFFIIRRREMKKMSATKTKPTNGSTAALLLQY